MTGSRCFLPPAVELTWGPQDASLIWQQLSELSTWKSLTTSTHFEGPSPSNVVRVHCKFYVSSAAVGEWNVLMGV
jgi:hypothetical protein